MARDLVRRLRSWEGLLLVVLLVVLAYNVTRVPNFLTISNQVNLAADDDEGHDQDHDRLLDAQLEEIHLVADGEEVWDAGDVVRQDYQQDDEEQSLPAPQAMHKITRHEPLPSRR